MRNEEYSQTRRSVVEDRQLVDVCTRFQSGWQERLIDWLGGDNHWLVRRCQGIMGNSVDAEDAAQEITMKVIQSIDSFEGRSSLRTWVCRVADNHCYTLIRSRSRHVLTEHLQFCVIQMEEDRSAGTADIDHDSIVIQVQSTLKRLTDINRQILTLRFFDELSIAQIASTLELTQSAAKMRLYRAMDVFREKYRYAQC